MLSDEEKIKLIEKESSEILPKDLTPEQDEFLSKQWGDLTEADKDLFYKVWGTHPYNIVFAVKQCKKEQILNAARTLQEIRETMIAGGANPTEFDDISASSLLETLNRGAKQCRS